MFISIIIPTFNRASFLRSSINSILNQTYQKFEIIVVDDGSTDNTKEVIKEFPQIRYFYQKNAGVSQARNLGIKKAKYEYIAFLDSDDEWKKDKLEIQIAFHKQNPNILISHTDETWIRNGKEIKKKNYQSKPQGFCFLENLNFCKIGTSTVLLKKSLLENIGYFDEDLKICEDYDLWLRISLENEIGYINQELVIKNAGHNGQLSFSEFGIDRYKIDSLQKHLDSKFKIEVKKELLKKLNILLKGARKHQNFKILKKYENIKI